jgi:hypothetical protein
MLSQGEIAPCGSSIQEQGLQTQDKKEELNKTKTSPAVFPLNAVDNRYYFKGVSFLLLLIFTYFIISLSYLHLHGCNIMKLFQGSILPSFNFIGGSSNALSIGIEAEAWSLFGVICQMAYISGRAILNKEFIFIRYLIIWISSSLYSWGVTVAVIFTLNIITLSISGIDITLKNAPIETIIALSFILGFFSDEAHKLLRGLRDKIATGLK